MWTTIAGPFGTYEAFSLPKKALFWGFLIALGIGCGAFVRIMVMRVLGLSWFWPAALTFSALNAILMTPPLSLIVVFSAGTDLNTVPQWPELALFVFLLTFGVALVRWTLGRELLLVETHPHADLPPVAERMARADPVVFADPGPEPAGPPPRPRLVMRLDPALQGPLISITVNDHYVEVRTVAGRGNLLMRLSDAIVETDEGSGTQVHRSHWVAWDAIDGVENKGGTTMLRLKEGGLVPVSRANRAKLKQRGLI